MSKVFQLRAIINAVHDGDTLYADVDQGLGIWNRGVSSSGMGLRILGINTRELHEPGGLEATNYVASLVPVGSQVEIVCHGWDKFAGRIDVSITLPEIGDLATHLIEAGWAAPWDGNGPRPVPPWPLEI